VEVRDPKSMAKNKKKRASPVTPTR
jgi:hypothetical protein